MPTEELHARAGGPRGVSLPWWRGRSRGKTTDGKVVSDCNKHSEGSRGTAMEMTVATECVSREDFSTIADKGRESGSFRFTDLMIQNEAQAGRAVPQSAGCRSPIPLADIYWALRM